jgi:hypothetical protein
MPSCLWAAATSSPRAAFCGNGPLPNRPAPLAVRWRDSLFISPMGGTMLLARRDVIGKQNEALAHLQERNALGRVARPFGGISAGVCLVQIAAPSAHSSGSTLFASRNAEGKKSVPRRSRIGKRPLVRQRSRSTRGHGPMQNPGTGGTTRGALD